MDAIPDADIEDYLASGQWEGKAGAFGYLLKEGRGGPKEPAKAFEWIRMAAESGHVQAQCDLAELYEKGLGTKRDLHQAVVWYTRAANADDPAAQNRLGEMYRDGVGVKKDMKAAERWFAKAENFNFLAARSLAKLRHQRP